MLQIFMQFKMQYLWALYDGERH